MIVTCRLLKHLYGSTSWRVSRFIVSVPVLVMAMKGVYFSTAKAHRYRVVPSLAYNIYRSEAM